MIKRVIFMLGNMWYIWVYENCWTLVVDAWFSLLICVEVIALRIWLNLAKMIMLLLINDELINYVLWMLLGICWCWGFINLMMIN